MKMAKKFLAVALAGVLALSVLTGCGASVKSKDVAKALTKMNIKVEQSKDVDKTAENTLKAIEAIIDAKDNADLKDDNANKIKLSNAVVAADGKVIKSTGVVTAADTAGAVKKALGIDTKMANVGKQIRVALVETEDATKDASLQAHRVEKALFQAQAAELGSGNDKVVAETGKLGTATTKDGKYMLVVIVNDVVAKA